MFFYSVFSCRCYPKGTNKSAHCCQASVCGRSKCTKSSSWAAQFDRLCAGLGCPHCLGSDRRSCERRGLPLSHLLPVCDPKPSKFSLFAPLVRIYSITSHRDPQTHAHARAFDRLLCKHIEPALFDCSVLPIETSFPRPVYSSSAQQTAHSPQLTRHLRDIVSLRRWTSVAEPIRVRTCCLQLRPELSPTLCEVWTVSVSHRMPAASKRSVSMTDIVYTCPQ